jgi:uncharacterized membrane protein HdeD (DUF308 family)
MVVHPGPMVPWHAMTLEATTIPPASASSPASRAFAVRGVLLLVFGVTEGALLLLAFRIPFTTVSMFVVIMAAFLVVDGLAAFVEAARARDRWLWLGLRAAAGILTGGGLLFLGPTWLVTIFGWWAILIGVVHLAASPVSRPVRVVLATLSVAVGLLLVVGVVPYPVSALLTISVYAIIAGGLQIALRSGRPARPGREVR